jgi:nicotinic acid mononucleotide adenylyltransferase
MHLPDPARLIADLAAADRRLVMVAAGGGALAISHLVTAPGSTGVVLAAEVPSARAAVDALLGGPQESYCSSRTARRLAVAAWQRASRLERAAGPAELADRRAVGVAVTGSLRTTRPKRGPHRVCVAVQTLGVTEVAEIELEKEARSRAEEEALAAALVFDVLARVTGLPAAAGVSVAPWLRTGERVIRDRVEPPEAWRELVSGTRRVVPAGKATGSPVEGGLVFPGSFDPLHEGHRLMARIAEEIAERPLDWELSIRNVDKPILDYLELRERTARFAGERLWLTHSATFLEKLDVFPESTFVMGADTYVRLGDPRYYGDSAAAAEAAVATIAARARGLIVFGRVRDGVFVDASQLEVPAPLRDIAYFVSPREFRLDISSTELRRQDLERRGQPCDA